MKKLQRFLVLLLVASLCLLVACGKSGGSSSNNEASKAATGSEAQDSDRVYSVGIIQLAPHTALDAGYQGFLEGLAERGYVEGKNLNLDYNNAQGDPSNATTIAQKLVNAKPDLIFAIATQAAQAAANQTSDIPIVITAVTDPQESGLVKSNEKPETNVTGTSDLTPVAEQLELIKRIMPDAKRVGVIFSSSEDNSLIQARMAQEKLAEMGLEYVELTVSKTDEITPVVQSAMGKIDVLYTPTDNLVSANMTAVTNVTTPAGIPVICGEVAMLEGGGLLTLGVDYHKLGLQAGQMAADILDGKAKPQDMPIQTQKDLEFAVNEDLAKKLGITIPEDLLKK